MKSLDEVNIVLAGVGGQGVMLASDVLGLAAISSGLEVKIWNVHGLAQREGSIYSHIRIGRKVFSPKIPIRSAHVLVGYELAEAVRHIHLLNLDVGVLLVNEQLIVPLAHYTGHIRYPRKEEILSGIASIIPKKVLYVIKANKLAAEAGNPKTVNVVMLGALAATGLLPFSPETLLDAIRQRVPSHTLKQNEKAFQLGYQEILKKNLRNISDKFLKRDFLKSKSISYIDQGLEWSP